MHVLAKYLGCGATMAMAAAISIEPLQAQTSRVDTGFRTEPVGPAQDRAANPADDLDIIVTAQRRSESIQDVPLSITVINGASLTTRGITNFQEYAALVPNIAFAYAGASVASSQSIALRGVFGNGTTGVYLDESPLPTSIDLRLVDLARIEVLRGPQGTLYGARSMGGTVRLITTQPDGGALSGVAHAGGSFTDQGGLNHSLDATLNVPIAGDTLSVRMTGFHDRDEGIFDRVPSAAAPVKFAPQKNVDDVEKWGGSVAIRAALADGKLVITPRVVLQRTNYAGRPYADIRPGNFQQARLFDVAEPGGDAYELYTLTAQYDAGFGTLTSATSQFNRRIFDNEDVSEFSTLFFGLPYDVPATISGNSQVHAFTQEVRFASNFGGPFEITAGGFYQHQTTHNQIPPTAFKPFISNIYSYDANIKTTELAAYAEASYQVFPTLTLIAGARAFDNKVAQQVAQDGLIVIPGSFGGQQKDNGINPKFSIKYEPAKQFTIYATAAKGFRLGGVNALPDTFCAVGLAQIGLNATAARSYKSDSLWSYELGAKAALFNRKVRLSGAVFQIDWSNVQQGLVIPGCGFGVTVNAGKARNRGFELEAQGDVVRGLAYNLGVGYTDAIIIDGGTVVNTIADGSRVQQVPRWTFNVGLAGNFKLGTLPTFANVDYGYTGSSVSLFNDSVNPRIRAAYAVVNGRFGVRFGRFEIAAFAKNLFNVHANFSDVPPLGAELPGRPRIATNRPRTLGVDARVRF